MQNKQQFSVDNHEEDIMKEIHDLCDSHLNNQRYGMSHRTKAGQVLTEIKLQKNIAGVLAILNGNKRGFRGIYDDTMNAEVMKKNDMSQSKWLIFIFLLIITFPLSVPLLAIHSWWTRGTPNFFKTDGAVLFDKILALCQNKNGAPSLPQFVGNTVVESHSLPVHPDQTPILPALGSLNVGTNTTLNVENSIGRVQESRFEESQRLERELEELYADRNGLITKDDKKNSNQQQITAINMRNRSMFNTHTKIPAPSNNVEFKLSSAAEQMPAPFEKLNSIFSVMLSDGFNKVMVDHSLKKYTGLPVVTSYRINSTSILCPNSFSMDIKCKFKWTSQPAKRVCITLFNTFDISMDEYVAPVPPAQSNEQLSYFYQLYVNGFALFSSKQKVADLLKKAMLTHDMYEKELIYQEALQLAQTPLESTQVLEAFINAYGKHYDRVERDSHLERGGLKQHFHDLLPVILAKIHELKKKLPENYWSLAQSAITLNAQFRQIYTLLQTGHINVAWVVYKPLKLTHFIQYAFPHLKAMDHQLSAIFVLSRHKSDRQNDGSNNFISENNIIPNALYHFRQAFTLLEPHHMTCANSIQKDVIASLESLIQVGKKAAEVTSYEEKSIIQEQEGDADDRLRAAGIDPTYRIPDEDIDADDELRVIQIPTL